MVALADSFLQDDDVRAAIDAALGYGELEGLDRAWLADRAEELREDAPLFSRARAQLVRDLRDPSAQRLGLTLAAKLVASLRSLQEEERAVLMSLADSFKIPPAERPALFAPWQSSSTFVADAVSYHRSGFNAPDRLVKQTLFEAMRAAETEQEFRLLAHKLRAVRSLISKLFDTADVLALGEIVRTGPYGFRIDGLIEHTSLDDTTPGYQRWLVRALAPGEALHPLEHSVLSTLALRLDETAHVLIVHGGDLSATDRVFIQSFPPHQIREERVDS